MNIIFENKRFIVSATNLFFFEIYDVSTQPIYFLKINVSSLAQPIYFLKFTMSRHNQFIF